MHEDLQSVFIIVAYSDVLPPGHHDKLVNHRDSFVVVNDDGLVVVSSWVRAMVW